MNESEIEKSHDSHFTRRISLHHLKGVNNPQSIHGIYPYRGKMSAKDAAQVISQLNPDMTLLDPFCGSGTILYEAQIRGFHTTGVDNNPLACMIARGKTESVDKEMTLTQLKDAIQNARSLTNFPSMPVTSASYFHEVTADQIMRIVSVSHDFSPFLIACVYGAICLAARACNNWLWTSTSIGKINHPLREVDFYNTLFRKALKHIDFVQGYPPAKIHTYDSRFIDEILPKQYFDCVYTSPPYFDALDYTGYYSRIVLEILGADRAQIRNGLIQRYSTFEEDMRRVLCAINRVVHDKSLIVFVVGNRMVNRRLIRGSDFFTKISPWGKPHVIEREYTKTASSLWDKINVTKRKEQIVVWDLAGGL